MKTTNLEIELKNKYITLRNKLNNGEHITEKDIKDNKYLISKIKASSNVTIALKNISTFKELKESNNKVLIFYYNYFLQLERDFYTAKNVRLHKNYLGCNILLTVGIFLGIITFIFNYKVSIAILCITIILDILKRFIIPSKILKNSIILSEKNSANQLSFIDRSLPKTALNFLK